MSSVSLISRKQIQSSAKSLISESMSVEISLMYEENNKRPRTVPYGTLDKTGAQSDFAPFTTNRCCLISHLTSQSLNLEGRRGTIDDVATILFHPHPSLSSAALRESPNTIPVHSLMLSSRLFLSFSLLSLSPAELSSPCQRILRCGHTI